MNIQKTLVLVAAIGFAASLMAGPVRAGDDTKKTEEAVKAPAKAAEAVKAAAGVKVADKMVLDRSVKKDPGPSNEYAVMKTNMGTVVLRFYPKQAPLAVSNFKGLAAKGFYKGVTFHRVINDFMIQGGDPTGTGRGGESLWGATFADEFSPELRFDRPGLLAMANRGPATNSSQFFITLAPTTHLNNKHTVFGEVVEGMDVVKAIAVVPKGAQDKPLKPVTIDSITFETR